MNTLNKVGQKGLNVIGGVGVLTAGTGAIVLMGQTGLGHLFGVGIAETATQNIAHIAGLGVVTALTAWGLKKHFSTTDKKVKV